MSEVDEERKKRMAEDKHRIHKQGSLHSVVQTLNLDPERKERKQRDQYLSSFIWYQRRRGWATALGKWVWKYASVFHADSTGGGGLEQCLGISDG